jgi:hypothetical protein
VIYRHRGGITWKKTVIDEVKGLVETAEYESRSKKRKQDFTRERKMSFKQLMWFMLNMVKDSSQNTLLARQKMKAEP